MKLFYVEVFDCVWVVKFLGVWFSFIAEPNWTQWSDWVWFLNIWLTTPSSWELHVGKTGILTTQAGNKSLSKHNTLNDIFYYNLF